jgi:hypothetical protein
LFSEPLIEIPYGIITSKVYSPIAIAPEYSTLSVGVLENFYHGDDAQKIVFRNTYQVAYIIASTYPEEKIS